MDFALVSHLSRTIRPAADSGSRLCNPGSRFFFVSGDFGFVLKCEVNVVEPIKQAISLEIANLEPGRECFVVSYQPGFQIDGNLESIASPGLVHQSYDLRIAEN